MSAKKKKAAVKPAANKAAGKKAAGKPAGKSAAKPAAKAPPAPKAAETSAAPKPKAQRPARKGPSLPPLPGIVKYEEPLTRHTTFRIGGPAQIHFQPAHAEAAAAAVDWAKREGLPWHVLGLGSNVLVRDSGFRGLVLKIGKGMDTAVNKAETWTVGAGLPTPLLARRTAEAGFAGVQRLIGVPGTVGGGVFMNAGCHGQDMAGVLVSARVLTPRGEMVDLPKAKVAFRYRASGLEGHVVLAATVKLRPEPLARIKADYTLYLKKRREGTPFDQPCCGSVFKNPPEMTAGKLIEKCGLKGRRVGAARVSELHANYIVNGGGATADDVLKLIDIARTAVFKEFGVELELEVQVIGDTK